MNIETIQKNKLGTILRFSIPSIISMLLSTIITITDGYFTGNYVGEDALAAINLGLPILYFFIWALGCVSVSAVPCSAGSFWDHRKTGKHQRFSLSLSQRLLPSAWLLPLPYIFCSQPYFGFYRQMAASPFISHSITGLCCLTKDFSALGSSW